MRKITWLHLSDRHWSKQNADTAQHLEGTLIEDIQKVCIKNKLTPDFIFFTGDLAYGDLPHDPIDEQFNAGFKLLLSIADALPTKLGLARIFLVPGNHDVNRAKTTRFERRQLFNEYELELIVKDMRLYSPEWDLVMDKLKNYITFLQRHGMAHLLHNKQRLTYATTIDTDAMNVGIVGFNSAWPCGFDVTEGQLLIGGRFQLDSVFEKIKHCDCKIALIHHPEAWYASCERDDLWKDLIRPRFQFSLHGHEHRNWFTSYSNEHITFGAGSVFSGIKSENTYSITTLDIDNQIGHTWFRTYSAKGGGGWGAKYIPSYECLPNESFKFTLPKSMVIRPRDTSLHNLANDTEHRSKKRKGHFDDIKLVVFDLDGTLVSLKGAIYSWAVIWRDLGYRRDIRKHGHTMYLERIISYPEWCDYCRNFFRLAGLTKEHLNKIVADYASPAKYSREVLTALKKRGYKLALVSGGIMPFLSGVFPDYNEIFDHVCINLVEFDKANLITRIVPTPYDFDGKREAITEISAKFGYVPEQVIFVGDADNDASVKRAVSKLIAIRTHEGSTLNALADFKWRNLRPLLDKLPGISS